ncbi:NAD(P)/FAD-dependent oxidoreductase [Acinetobacter sp. ANC 5383]
MISVEMPTTYYTTTKKYHLNLPVLEQDLDVDVVIIGAGFSGVNTGLELIERGVKSIAILESNYVGFGGSGRNGGHIMAGIGHDLDRIKKFVGEDGLNTIFEISDSGSIIIKERIQKYQIDADVVWGYGYLGFNQRQARLLQQWEKEYKSINPDIEIEFLEGQAVKNIVGSDAYSCALKHMGNGHFHSLNMLLGSAQAFVQQGGKIYEYSPAVEVEYGDQIRVRTAKGSIRAKKLLWSCGAFLNRLEPFLHKKTINTYAFQLVTEPLSEEMIHRISPIRGAFSDIRPVIDYYRVTNENRLLFGSATACSEYIPTDLKQWNRELMLKVFPYLKDVHIDLAWGGPMECSATLFPQIGNHPEHKNVFYVQGYSGFGVTPSHVISQVIADGMLEGSKYWDVISSIPKANVWGKEHFKTLLLTAAKISHQLQGFTNGRR